MLSFGWHYENGTISPQTRAEHHHLRMLLLYPSELLPNWTVLASSMVRLSWPHSSHSPQKKNWRVSRCLSWSGAPSGAPLEKNIYWGCGMKRRTMMAMRHADLLEVQWVFLILALRCPLAQFLSWRTEPTCAKVRKYLLMHTYLTSRHRCTITKFCLLHGILAAMIVLSWSFHSNGDFVAQQLKTRLHAQFVATTCWSIIQVPTTMNGAIWAHDLRLKGGLKRGLQGGLKGRLKGGEP